MNTEEKIQHIKDLAKARAKKYYEKNIYKAKILEKRKLEREQLNKTIQKNSKYQLLLKQLKPLMNLLLVFHQLLTIQEKIL